MPAVSVFCLSGLQRFPGNLPDGFIFRFYWPELCHMATTGLEGGRESGKQCCLTLTGIGLHSPIFIA